MQECPVCKKQSRRSWQQIQIPPIVLTLTTCEECQVVIGATTTPSGKPLVLQLREIEDRLAKLEEKKAAT